MDRFDKVYELITERLRQELPSYMTYHNIAHTERVLKDVEVIAKGEGVSGEDLLLLKTAALFHDTGFLRSEEEHEEHSCLLARACLPKYSYTEREIDIICMLIIATRLPQSPYGRLSEILCDADLFYLGDNDYEAEAAELYQEMQGLGGNERPGAWKERQIAFLSSHAYFTETARAMQNKGKEENLNKLTKQTAKRERSQQMGGQTNSYRNGIVDLLYMVFGVFVMGLALKYFLVPNHFFDGGITGISLLIHEIYHINLALVIIVLNIPFVIMSAYIINRKFALRTLLSIVLLGICLVLLPTFPATTDKLLISIFGGAFLGVGVGLVMRAGAAIDGIEILALYTLRKTSFTVTEIIFGINIVIFTLAGFVFGIETALYSIMTYFAATKSIDFVVEGVQAFTGVTIISSKSESIKQDIVHDMQRGITVYNGKRGFLPNNYEHSEDCEIIFTVITRMELRKLKNIVHSIDPNAFMYVNSIKETSGGIINVRNRH